MPFTVGDRDFIDTSAKYKLSNKKFETDTSNIVNRTTDLFTNTWAGLKTNNTITSAFGLTQKEKFEAEEGYNPFEDQDINMFGFDMTPFLHSESKAQSKAIANQILYRSKFASSPAYVMGSFLGYLFDPSTLLLGYGKIPQALMKGSLASKTKKFVGVNTLEEGIKQQNDPLRTDFESYMTIGASAIIPSIFQGLKHLGNSRNNNKTIFEYNLIKDYSEKTTRSSKIKDDVVDATFKDADDNILQIETVIINDLKKFASETIEQESTVGAKQIPKNKNIKKQIEGEQIQPTGLNVFGEKSQFTPIFDVLNNSLLLSDKKMITRLTATPLAQMKNTKEFGFQASEKSIDVESEMFMHSRRYKHIFTTYDLFAQYLKRVANKDIKFNEQMFLLGNKNDHIGLNEFRNAVGMQLFYGAKEYKPNLNGVPISIPEVQKAARATREFIYEPVGKMADEYKMFSIIPERELLFWQDIQKTLKRKKEDSITFKSVINEGEERIFTIKEIIGKIQSLERRVKHLDTYGGLRENYVNRIWNKAVIEKDIEGFKKAVLQALEPDQKINIDNFVRDILEQTPYIRAHTAQGNEADMFVFQSPRYSRNVRNRTIKLRDYELAEQGYLELDVFGLADIYMRHMVPDLFITKYFGDPNAMGFRVARGTNKEGMLKSDDVFYEDGLIQIRDQYEQLIQKAKTTKQQKEIRTLEKRMLLKLEASRDLVKGFYGVSETPYSAFSVGIKSAKVINNIVNLTGLAQIADVGRTVMMNGLTRTFGGLMDGWDKGLMTFRANGMKEGNTVGEAIDMYFSNRASQLGNTQDLFSNFSSRPDAILGKVENFTFKYINMMSFWNQEMKGVYSFLSASRTADVSLKYAIQEGRIDLGTRKLTSFFTEKATDVEIKNLATLGIDLDKAVRIAKEVLRVSEFSKYNIVTKKDLWTDQIALDAFNYALKKDINIGIVTPGKGDTPLWMSSEFGGFISQYKKFAMGATQRVLMRGLQDSDSKFLIGLIMMTAMGMLVDKIRTEQYGKDYSKKSAVAKLTDGIDRSGVTGIFFDLNNSIERMFHNQIGLRSMLGTNKPYGSDLADQIGVIGGPNVGLVDKLFNIMYDVGSGGYDQQTASNVRRILPWQNVWYLDWLFDQAEQGMK